MKKGMPADSGGENPYDAKSPMMLLAADVTVVAVTDDYKNQGDPVQLLPNESVPQSIATLSPGKLTPRKRDFYSYEGSSGAMRHHVTMERARKQRASAPRQGDAAADTRLCHRHLPAHPLDPAARVLARVRGWPWAAKLRGGPKLHGVR